MLVSDIVSPSSLVQILRRAMTCVDSEIVLHEERVAYILYCMLLCEGGYSRKELDDAIMLAFLHDIGGFKKGADRTLIDVETEDPWVHSTYGYVFLKDFSPLSELADSVLFHHVEYENLSAAEENSGLVRNSTLINKLFLADRIERMLHFSEDISEAALQKLSGAYFCPLALELFYKANKSYRILENLENGEYLKELTAIFSRLHLLDDELECYLLMIIFLIDFRSEFTVTHTIMTVSLSTSIAEMMGANDELLRDIHIGAMLHDIGKISTPVDILESSGSLSDDEMSIMQDHVSMSERILSGCLQERILMIAVRHHEKLDGTGYPHKLSGNMITTPERIVAVADILSALQSRRSYKGEFSREKVLGIIKSMSDSGKIDSGLVTLVTERYDEIMESSYKKSQPVLDSYRLFLKEYDLLYKEITGKLAKAV